MRLTMAVLLGGMALCAVGVIGQADARPMDVFEHAAVMEKLSRASA